MKHKRVYVCKSNTKGTSCKPVSKTPARKNSVTFKKKD